ncbi:MAG: DUF2520 domain-containing protein [Bacteroidota bacterium]
MSFGKIETVVLIGAGNMASHLGPALVSKGIRVAELHNRTEERGMALAARLGAAFIPDIRDITSDADLYIIAVADTAISQAVDTLKLNDRLVVHTSGTISMETLSQVSGNIGVFYPLQTFSSSRSVGFAGIPVCLEANTVTGKLKLEELARKLTDIVYFIDSEQRRLLHLAAIFASNFANFMNVVAFDLLESNGISFDILKPLIAQTAENVRHGHPFNFQTGPAFRGDMQVLDDHRELLSSHPGYLEIYNNGYTNDGFICWFKHDRINSRNYLLCSCIR